MKIGITGGIGCGKSTVLEHFQALKLDCLSSDSVAQGLIAEDPQVIASIKEKFGQTIFRDDGSVDRSQLAELVFSDHKALLWLEGLLHPLVREHWVEFTKADQGRLVFVEIPLLFEKKLEKHFDFIVCITCTEHSADIRLREKGLSALSIQQRRDLQLPNSVKIKHSDFVLDNNGSLEFLKLQLNRLYHTLESLQAT